MATVEDVVIVGAGIAGLATALGLHRMGIKSLVLEASDELRASGYAMTVWGNAWRAMDALGVGDSLRHQSPRLVRQTATSLTSSLTSEISLTTQGKCGEHEVHCVKRSSLLETLAKELPKGTIRYSSKLVSIDAEADDVKLLHLVDGSVLKTKVLLGCDGVNSAVAKWLDLKKPSFSGRSASRGFATYPNGHGFKPADFAQYFGKGFRFGLLPCDEKSIYWFFTWTTAAQAKEVGEDPAKMKRFLLDKMRMPDVPEEVVGMIERSEIGGVVSSPLRYRWPFELLWGNISKGNVCVAGDALHPMTPDLGQGGCAALEDGVVLARCLGEALSGGGGAERKAERIRDGLAKYAKERKWRSFDLVATSYVLGVIQASDGSVLNFLRDKCFPAMLAKQYLKKADFDCGKI